MSVATASSRAVRDARLFIFFIFVVSKKVVIFIIVSFFFDGGYFERIDGNDLEIGAALVAGDYLTCIYVINIDIQRVIAFGAND
jgi:hypothetical protein